MADILIKNMEIPKSCYECWNDRKLNIPNCPVFKDHILRCQKRHPSCPLVELPPHGKLKDYDKIKEVLTKNFDVHADSLVYYILSLIDETDTVLEASNG